MNDQPIYSIQSKRLSKSYKDVNALRSLDLQVPRNSIFGFLGPNGAGKTTTIKLLLGLTRPTAGIASISIDHVTGSRLLNPGAAGHRDQATARV